MNELEKLYRAKLEAVGYQPKQNPPIWEMPAVTNGKNDELPPHLEAGMMVPVSDENGRVVSAIRKTEYDRMERQLAAAERLYFAATEGLGWLVAQEWEVSMSAIVALEKALTDYANAKDAK